MPKRGGEDLDVTAIELWAEACDQGRAEELHCCGLRI